MFLALRRVFEIMSTIKSNSISVFCICVHVFHPFPVIKFVDM